MLVDNIVTNRLVLRNLTAEDVDNNYVNWLHDVDVTKYLEVRFQINTLESVIEYIKSINGKSDSILFGLFLRDGKKHIGNIKIGPINPHHHRSEIGIMIGDRDEWGKGFASEAIGAVSDFCFNKLGLHKILAGCYEQNVGSLQAFLKVGFQQEGSLSDHWADSGNYQAQLLLGLTRAQFSARTGTAEVIFKDIHSLTFIGGGALMIASATYANQLGYRVGAILAPRHAEELLSNGKTVYESLCSLGVQAVVVDDINTWSGWADFTCSGAGSLALCFGPAWIFSSEVIKRFSFGMINFNGIPIPEYLGGAHYTWQILHNNRVGGCFLQVITNQVDQGDILRHEYFDLPETTRTPADYFASNHDVGLQFLMQALNDIKCGVVFKQTPYNVFNQRRLYFPRLYSKENAYIDWRWNGEQIESFCNAFDTPYMGAATFWKGNEIRLHNVNFESSNHCFHPFTSGLVVRRYSGRVWVAVTGGLLELGSATKHNTESVLADMKEGDRLSTPSEQIQKSLEYSAKFSSTGIAK